MSFTPMVIKPLKLSEVSRFKSMRMLVWFDEGVTGCLFIFLPKYASKTTVQN